MIPHPREDEMVNKLSHGTVPLNHTQCVNGSAARFSISRKVLEKGPPGCSAEIRTGTYTVTLYTSGRRFLPNDLRYTPKR